jgi:hypothetical protein
VGLRISIDHRNPSILLRSKTEEHSMGSGIHGIALGVGGNRLLDTLRAYVARYRLPLYLLSTAAVASGVVLNWNWLAAAGLVRLVTVLPCALMMFSCIRHGVRRPAEETALRHEALPSQLSTSSDPQQ